MEISRQERLPRQEEKEKEEGRRSWGGFFSFGVYVVGCASVEVKKIGCFPGAVVACTVCWPTKTCLSWALGEEHFGSRYDSFSSLLPLFPLLPSGI